MRRITPRQFSLLLILGTALLALAIYLIFPPRDSYRFPAPLRTRDTGTTDLSDRAITAEDDLRFLTSSRTMTNYRSRVMTIDESFTSNLPIVLLDTGGERPERHVAWDSEANSFLPVAESYVFLNGTLRILDKPNRTNTLTDKPAAESEIRLRQRGNSSVNYDKKQYLIKLVDEQGNQNKQDLLGMGADNEWILNISFIDKSLMRNYLAYTAAGELNSFTPDARFCELVWKDGDEYHYEGVYLLCESVKVGKRRVNLPRFSENAQNLPFLLRRDRYDPYGVLLDNYANREGLIYGYLDVKWPPASVLTDKTIDRITRQIDRFEEALFAEDYSEFIRYREYIDMDSFVDYFILNEYFLSYDAGFNSTYIYSDYSGRLHMGPVWDFDGTIDNYHKYSAKLDTTAFHASPWFQQILRDPEFTLAIIRRYAELRESILSDEAVGTFIDETVEGLGTAVDRDWARWGYFYQGGEHLRSEEGEPDRNTLTYAEEIEKIKRTLSTHGVWLDEHFDSLYQFSAPDAPEPVVEEAPANRGQALAVVFIVIFFIAVILVQRMDQGQ